jgi:hypothetical protein
MRTRSVAALLFTAALVGGPLTATAAADTPPLPTDTGCPAGQALTLDFLRQVGGYHVPFIIDAEGNNDGIVCGRAWSEAKYENACPNFSCGVPVIYDFRDNTLPAKM